MVQVFERNNGIQKSKSFHLKKILEIPGKHLHKVRACNSEDEHDSSQTEAGCQVEPHQTRVPPNTSGDRPLPSISNENLTDAPASSQSVPASGKSAKLSIPSCSDDDGSGFLLFASEMELMKERFAKLLLGEDMSGGGKGVSSALALSNAITNLAASVFGEQCKLEPMSADMKARWKKEIGWLLSVTDHVVEFVPSQQKSNDGTKMEIMVTQQRNDLHMNIPALKKLDAMLIDCLDNFKDQKDFWYGPKDEKNSNNGSAQRKSDKWWLPTVKVPPEGLSEMSRRWLHFQKESVNQVLKAALAINAQVLSEIEIPDDYIESLPKNGKTSLGDTVYKSITVDHFDPEDFLSAIDLSTEHKVLDLKDRIEASIVIWQRKMHNKDSKSAWGSAVSLEKRELFEDRAETILLLLKQRFPGISQSALDISKIQYNRDVGQAVLESYSRIIESLAFTVMSRIEDVLYADFLTQNPSLGESRSRSLMNSSSLTSRQASLNRCVSMERPSSVESPSSKTLSDIMGWHLDSKGGEIVRNESGGNFEEFVRDGSENLMDRVYV